MRRSFWKYYKDNGLWKPITIITIALLIGITATVQGYPWMGVFMAGIVLFMFGADYLTWKKRG